MNDQAELIEDALPVVIQEEDKFPDTPAPKVIQAFKPGYEMKKEPKKFRIYFMNKLWLQGNRAADSGGAKTEKALLKIAEGLGVYR